MILRQGFLGDQRMGLAVAQISWRRTDQFRNFMRVLKLRAVHFNYRSGITEQDFSRCFHHARFSGASGAKKKKISDGPARRVQPRPKHLVQIHDRLHGFVLPHDPGAKRFLKVSRLDASPPGVQHPRAYRAHGYLPKLFLRAPSVARLHPSPGLQHNRSRCGTKGFVT